MQIKLFWGAVCLSAFLAGNGLMPTAAEEQGGHIHGEPAVTSTSVLTLADAIGQTLEASPRLKSATAGLEAAKGAEEQAGYLPNPAFDFQAENIAGSGRYSGVDSAEMTYGLSQEVETGGKRSYRRQAANQSVALGTFNLTLEKLDLIRDVEVAYYQAVAAQQLLALAGERKELAENVLSAVKKRVDAAREPEMQLDKARIAVASARFAHERAEREFQHTKHVLASLWSGHNEEFSLDESQFRSTVAPPDESEVEAKLEQAPDIRQWEAKRKQQEALYELERAQAMPNPKVSLGVRDLRERGDQAFVAGVSIPIPVFNANAGNIVSARNTMLKTESDSETSRLNLRNTAFQWLEEMTNAYYQAETLQTAIIPSAQNAFTLAREGYDTGRFPYLEVLDAQRTLFEVKKQYIQALQEYHIARANVQRLTTDMGDKK